jgi:hypothetical protein
VNADLSVAPEIAQLAAPAAAALPPHPRTATAPRTAGRTAGELARLAAAPGQWWDLVRFDPAGPVRIPVPGTAGAWLLVLPPDATADCDCAYATLLAGEATESAAPAAAPAASPTQGRAAAPATPLRAGRVRVHGRPAPHQIRGAGHGYAVSLHWGACSESGITRTE